MGRLNIRKYYRRLTYTTLTVSSSFILSLLIGGHLGRDKTMKKYVAGRVLFMSKGVTLVSVVMLLSSFT